MDDALGNVIIIVTGSNLTAEQKDRPLAYYLKTQIDRYGGDDPTRCGLVVSDHWYMNTKEIQECATISVGGPTVNALTQHLWHRLPMALAVDNVFVIQADITFEDLRASIWGTSHETTREAIQTFHQKGYLRRFLEAAWGATIDEPEAPKEGDQAKG